MVQTEEIKKEQVLLRNKFRFFFFNFELYLSFFALPLGALPLGTDIVVLPIRLSFNF